MRGARALPCHVPTLSSASQVLKSHQAERRSGRNAEQSPMPDVLVAGKSPAWGAQS